jgi:glutamine amidotransferase
MFPVKTLRFKDSAEYKVPHTGWNQVYPEKENPLFENIPSGSHFYFVHSYFIEYDKAYTLSSTIITMNFRHQFGLIIFTAYNFTPKNRVCMAKHY